MDFGDDPTLLSVTYGGANGTRYKTEQCSLPASRTHTTIVCMSVTGTGFDHAFVVTVNGLESQAFSSRASYAAPVILKVEPVLPAALPLSGGEVGTTDGGEFLVAASAAVPSNALTEVVVRGTNFGAADQAFALEGRYSNEVANLSYVALGCRVTEPHVEITCQLVPGIGARHRWAVVVDGLVSTTPSISYAPPTVLGIVLSAGAGSEPLTPIEGGSGTGRLLSSTNEALPTKGGKNTQLAPPSLRLFATQPLSLNLLTSPLPPHTPLHTQARSSRSRVRVWDSPGTAHTAP